MELRVSDEISQKVQLCVEFWVTHHMKHKVPCGFVLKLGLSVYLKGNGWLCVKVIFEI